MRKCLNCICCSCLSACCDRKKCKGKKTHCSKYAGFEQLNIFNLTDDKKYMSAPRATWEEYGLDDKSYRKMLYEVCRSGKYEKIIKQVAYQTCPDIAEHLIKSVTQKKSYDKIEFDLELGRICVGKTNFYGYRRLFYHLFDLEVRKFKIGTTKR